MQNSSLTLFRPNFKRAEPPDLEPGLLAAFRLAIVLQSAGQIIFISFGIFFEPGIVWETTAAVELGGLVLLLFYLSWPRLWQQLGRAYLPIGLVLLTFGFMLESALVIYFHWQQPAYHLTEQEITNISWRFYLVVLIPLVLTAWQYRFALVLTAIGVFFVGCQLGGLWFFGLKFYQMRDMVEMSFAWPIVGVVISYMITQLRQVQSEQQEALIRANTQLVAANRKLAEHAATVEALAVTRERNRMARDLHDTLANTLTAVAVQLAAADNVWDQALEQARALVSKALGTARSGLDETRRAIKALRAAPLEDLGLALAIRTLAESIVARTGAQLEADLAEDISLSPAVEQTVYRIVQEVLTNIAKHAQAQTVRLTLEKLNQGLLLVIADDGVGFALEQAAPEGHYGLQGLYEQARVIGAQLQIESQPQRGATVRLRLDQQPEFVEE